MTSLRQASCLIVVLCVFSISVAKSSIGGNCVKRFTKGRWKSSGNCDVANEQQIGQKIMEELKVAASKPTKLQTTAVTHTTPQPPLSMLFPNDPITTPVSPYDCGKEGNISVTGRCMFIPRLTASRDVGYDEAIALCNDGGGSLAEIHDRNDENALSTHLTGKLPSKRRYVYMWIGMLYDYQKSTVLFKSGKELSITNFAWYTNFPKGTDRPYMMVESFVRGNRPKVWNERRKTPMHGVLCQKLLWQPGL